MNSRGQYPRKGPVGRARSRKEEECSNILRASFINDKNPSTLSQGQFMSKRYDRGKGNQFCTGREEGSGSLTSLCNDVRSTRSLTSLGNNARKTISLTSLNDAGSATSKGSFNCHSNDKYASVMNRGRFMSKRHGRGKTFSGMSNPYSANSVQSAGSFTGLVNGAHSTLGRRTLKSISNGTVDTRSHKSFSNSASSAPGTRFRTKMTESTHTQGTRSLKSLSNDTCLEKSKPNTLDLKSINELKSNEVVLEILQHPSCWKDIVSKDDIKDDVILSLIGILAHAVNTKLNKEKLYHLLYETLQERFVNKLCTFTLTVKKMNPETSFKFFDNLALVLEVYSQALINSAVDRFPSLIDACIASQTVLKLSPKLLERYKCLQEMLSQVKLGFKNNYRHPNELNIFKLNPPTDFVLISVYPTKEDWDGYGCSLLRPNITKGKYESCGHYLDVQFRLLREDFMRPLREGVTAYRKDAQSKNLDVWVNRNVRILKPDIMKRELIHYVQFQLPKMFSPLNSKRFMFGNLLCFSWNNFESIIIATIFDADCKNLKQGKIAVKFESNTELDYSKEYVMIESRAFFLAYKHVLTALIKMCGEELPFSSYFVHTQTDVDPPDYLTNEVKYDLRVLKDGSLMQAMKPQKSRYNYRTRRILLQDSPSNALDYPWSHLQSVRVIQDLELWPSESDLGLDTSQRKVLKHALTRELVIIQGPPGTGKTFIGLKIAQLLLHNNLYSPGPILVVCFTNHALDQFLEGIMSFTENIVRVGSRINNDKIQKFQVNTLLKIKKYEMYHNNYNISDLHKELDGLERKIRSLKVSIMECIEPKGILCLEELTACGIIPCHLQSQIGNFHGGLVGWLTAEQDYTSVCPAPEDMGAALDISTSDSDDCNEFFDAVSEFPEISCEEVDLMKDVQELNRFEEQSRKMELFNDVQEGKIKGSSFLKYALKIKCLYVKIEELEEKLEAEPKDIVSFINYNINIGRLAKVKAGLAVKNVPQATRGDKIEDLFTLDFNSRWQLYRSWLDVLIENFKIRLSKAEDKYKETSLELKEVLDQRYIDIMKESSVVGMTTTAAAQHHGVMQAVAPPVVIIEEAAEVLESHVITSLSANCKHLIMIGDHKQLRPSTTVHDLATKFGLDVSLFERMINNGLPYDTLEYQHRMRPSISRLLVPAIYPELKDHKSVNDYPHVRGVSGDVFFVTHNIPQDKGVSNNTHRNTHEANFIMRLCQHLIMQDYNPADVTILTPYSGQFFLLRELQRKNKRCEGVRISVVDNFQGEENKIILLSLVRSNDEGKVGFLRIDNRVCVALSRAKHGLYVIGNMDLLSASSNLWKHVKADLLKEGSLGHTLTLKCKNHPGNVIQVSSLKDFEKKSPQGGCWEYCETVLPKCDHKCPRHCHANDPNHERYECLYPCSKLCERGHICPLPCSVKCQPCNVIMTKLLPCGHRHELKCHVLPDEHMCNVIVEKERNKCKHKINVQCHEDPDDMTCPEDCNAMLPCGHTCKFKCHGSDHSLFKCKDKCENLLHCGHKCPKICSDKCDGCNKLCEKILPCGHPCQKLCSTDCGRCRSKCENLLPCGHPCPLRCSDECGGCTAKCERLLSCGHHCPLICSDKCGRCNKACEKILSCGHPCPLTCPDKCGRCNKKCTNILLCGHPCPLTCPDECGKCKEKCEKMLPCGHPCPLKCQDKCGRCEEKCEKILPCGHPCPQKCSFKCGGCDEKCEKILPCGHPCALKCQDKCGRCGEKCEKILPCGHPCPQKCSSDCGGCRQLIKKSSSDCGHEVQVKCSEPATSKSCLGKCPLLLKCGHPCTKRCCDPCTERCQQEVNYASCPYNHSITKPCHISDQRPTEATWGFCRARCGQVLPCGHTCQGSCGLCRQGRLHLPCIKRCERKLVCGHRCQELCGTVCPPCRQAVKWCPHVSKMICGAQLPICRKPCSSTCKHHQCSSKCSDNCPIPLCQEPCSNTLKCGHLCIGFCGDPCPPLCLICHDAENVPETDNNTRYVLLEDCGHVIEVKALDVWMMKQNDAIGLKTCPKCANPIHYNRRYKRIIQGMHQDLSIVKRMYMDKKPNISSVNVTNSLRDFMSGDYFSNELYTLMTTMNMAPNKKSFKKRWMQDAPKLSYSELRLIDFKAKVLKKAYMIKARVMEHHSSPPDLIGLSPKDLVLMLFTFKSRLFPQLETLVKRVMELRCHEASEFIDGTSCELQRMLLLPSFWLLEKKCQSDPDTQMKDVYDKLVELFNPKNKFTYQQETEVLKLLRKCGDGSSKYLIIYDNRRVGTQMGVKMTQGTWFKCQQGHIYATEVKDHKCYRCVGRGYENMK
nr:NFX1-type zinc finger-containing protein 1-like isoform X1 [Procambarus clarkii]XP_045621589.1 NFX1-type zinc finger-containing protein 1-like isoform X1 [Procambarus clarkii]XP_045621590.1 NFX1-type zinc finger-containing protein 1-like isoform X1 [Procambarus clarkii]XP_045621591.1 NFX1-type zinc finger-containing protein 1-like isoform X1 [Procambarus clarkii]XP_045621592.1 NFX1-type zinc finger-containing protein 1-like isoform X1 [Procambarus clarkii]